MKILAIIILTAFTIHTNAQLKLPFIGTREFNFSGGSCCNQSITIFKDGTCEIKAYEAPDFGNNVTTNYTGKFTSVIWVYENGEKSFGYKVEPNHITSMNKNGKPEVGCKEDGMPCIEPFYGSE